MPKLALDDDAGKTFPNIFPACYKDYIMLDLNRKGTIQKTKEHRNE